jgi:hypothetical protein
MLISADRSDDEFVCIAQVPKAVVESKALKANEWLESVKQAFEGAKSGGREETAQMSGKGVSRVCFASSLTLCDGHRLLRLPNLLVLSPRSRFSNLVLSIMNPHQPYLTAKQSEVQWPEARQTKQRQGLETKEQQKLICKNGCVHSAETKQHISGLCGTASRTDQAELGSRDGRHHD